MTEAPTAPAPEALAADDPNLIYEDYWGTNEEFNYLLPDGKQFFTIKPMNEGAKAKFQKKTNKGIRVNQRTQDALLDVDPADERWTLIKESVVGWHIMQRDPQTGQFTEYPSPQAGTSQLTRALEQLLDKFDPKIIQDLEFFIRTKNPWMQADMDVEEIDKEIDRLNVLRKQKMEQDAGEGSSANK